jgi:hypothetical protein
MRIPFVSTTLCFTAFNVVSQRDGGLILLLSPSGVSHMMSHGVRLALARGGNAYSVGVDKIDGANLARYFDGFSSGFLLRFGKEREQELIRELTTQLVEIGRKGYRSLRAQIVIGFSTRLFGKLREIILTPIGKPVAMSKMSRAWRIEAIDDDASTLRVLNGCVKIRIWESALVHGIDP